VGVAHALLRAFEMAYHGRSLLLAAVEHKAFKMFAHEKLVALCIHANIETITRL
jgi:hypothetical protein